MNPYYECHITMKGDKEFIRNIVQSLDWKFSAIDGDPVLGDGVLCYATKHFKGDLEENYVRSIINGIAVHLEYYSVNVLRRKIELVIYDVR